MVAEAVWDAPETTFADTGDPESDLRAFIDRLARFYSRPEVVAALPGLVTEAVAGGADVPELSAVVSRGGAHLKALLETARQSGRLRATGDDETLEAIVLGGDLTLVILRSIAAQRAVGTQMSDAGAVFDFVRRGLFGD